MGRVTIDILRANKPKRSGTHFACLSLEDPQLLPSVGDFVVVKKGDRARVIQVERRLFDFTTGSLYVQLYFSKSE